MGIDDLYDTDHDLSEVWTVDKTQPILVWSLHCTSISDEVTIESKKGERNGMNAGKMQEMLQAQTTHAHHALNFGYQPWSSMYSIFFSPFFFPRPTRWHAILHNIIANR